MRWQDWMNPLVGLWLVVAPYILAYEDGYGGVSAWNSYVVGAALIAIPLLGLVRPLPRREWIVLLLGIWLLISPLVLGFFGLVFATSNTMLCGLVVTIDGAARVRAIGKGPRGA
ncbi:SPW repeat protein [Alkalilimnicola ehrlichii]|nr:SPW repeat protein [Alkalilimnicola ehrlichii]